MLLTAAKKHSKFAYAMYMSAANFAFHPLEVAELKHDGLDLKDRILDSYREKDGIQHVAHVWTETIKAIKDFKTSDEFGNHSQYLFVVPKDSKRKGSGEPWDTHRVDRLHRKLRSAAGLPVAVKFDGIRKMTSTAMGAEHQIAQDWVMGHSGGMKDRYTTQRIASETKKALMKARKAILGK